MHRPFIHVNFAVDASCETDWQRVHELRERYDAVAVGARTWNADRPRLNVRPERLGREPRRQPARAIFAGRQRCEINGDGPLFLIGAPPDDCRGATLIPSGDHDLRIPLEALYDHGIASMLVEGGPTILQSFFDQELVDTVTIYVRAHDEASAHLAARRALPFLPATLSGRTFGAGFLLGGAL